MQTLCNLHPCASIHRSKNRESLIFSEKPRKRTNEMLLRVSSERKDHPNCRSILQRLKKRKPTSKQKKKPFDSETSNISKKRGDRQPSFDFFERNALSTKPSRSGNRAPVKNAGAGPPAAPLSPSPSPLSSGKYFLFLLCTGPSRERESPR